MDHPITEPNDEIQPSQTTRRRRSQPAQSSQPARPIPDILRGKLTLKHGQEKTGRSAIGTSEFEFKLDDGIEVIRGHCGREFNQLRLLYIKGIIPTFSDSFKVFLKPSKNATQTAYVEVTNENIYNTIAHAWRNGHSWTRNSETGGSDGNAASDFKFEFFIWCTATRLSTGRLTQANLERSVEQVQEQISQMPENERPGSLERRNWENSNARTQQNPVTRPDTVTARQLRNLDAIAYQNLPVAESDYARVEIKEMGVHDGQFGLLINIKQLRMALGMPAYSLLDQGILHGSTIIPPFPTPTNNIPDEDHDALHDLGVSAEETLLFQDE